MFNALLAQFNALLAQKIGMPSFATYGFVRNTLLEGTFSDGRANLRLLSASFQNDMGLKL